MKNLTGGIIFHDGHMFKPVRIVISFMINKLTLFLPISG